MAMIGTMPPIAVQRVDKSRLKETDLEHLKFGRVFTDHMFMMDYVDGAWQQPRIMPYADLELSPATLVLHYAQTIFEGMKAYRDDQGKVSLFRPHANIARMNRSAHRMCMPAIPEEVFLEGLKELVRMDAAWLDAHHPLPKPEWVKLFKQTFRFTGGEIVGEFLLSTGYLPGAHEPGCPAYARILKLNPPWAAEKRGLRAKD